MLGGADSGFGKFGAQTVYNFVTGRIGIEYAFTNPVANNDSNGYVPFPVQVFVAPPVGGARSFGFISG